MQCIFIYKYIIILEYKNKMQGEFLKRFKIPTIPPTTNKCIRFPNDVIEQVEESIKGKECTFSAFVIEAVRVALSNLAEDLCESE